MGTKRLRNGIVAMAAAGTALLAGCGQSYKDCVATTNIGPVMLYSVYDQGGQLVAEYTFDGAAVRRFTDYSGDTRKTTKIKNSAEESDKTGFLFERKFPGETVVLRSSAEAEAIKKQFETVSNEKRCE